MVDDDRSMEQSITMLQIARKILILEEGYQSKVYPSFEGGTDTAGIGHKLTPSEAKKWKRGYGVSREQIESWYLSDISKSSAAVVKWLGMTTFNRMGPLRRALAVCMAFQMGEAGLLAWKETAEHVRRGEWTAVRDHIAGSKWAQQTPKRARRMATMWVENRLLEEYESPVMLPDGA